MSKVLAKRLLCSTAIAALLSLIIGAARSTAQSNSQSTEIKKTPASYTSPSSGKSMYLAYCASCHGNDGKGNGPAARALKLPPRDLTQLAAENGGRFPENEVIHTIKGDSSAPSHGSKDMPVWGPVFHSMGTPNDGTIQLRVRNLTAYIAALQAK